MTAATIRYAAYGSNLHPLRLAARITSARLLGCQKHDFPAHYRQAIESVAVMEDRNDQRRARHWQLVERLRNDI